MVWLLISGGHLGRDTFPLTINPKARGRLRQKENDYRRSVVLEGLGMRKQACFQLCAYRNDDNIKGFSQLYFTLFFVVTSFSLLFFSPLLVSH